MAVVICRRAIEKLLFLFFICSFISKSGGNDILGCGGFVKSHANLDFSKIEIGLYSKEGILKERTECAPTNGYYFLPLYEKGDYILKVHPPAGWSFEPSEVELHVDGTTDQCSIGQDINFSFNGFGITGKVITAGQSQGPNGISVQLVDDKGEKRDTLTTVGGDFHFTPVIPGKYTLKASHQRWELDPAQAVVHVKEGNTALPVGVLAVKGYDVKGSVISYGNPIGGVYVLLYSKEEKPKYRVEGCNTALLQGVPDSPICHSVTDASGEFSFGLVPAGEYKLLALSKSPGNPNVGYDLKPDSVSFSVQHDSLYIKNAFEVHGYTVSGRVLRAAGGAGLAGARVSVAGHPAATTDSQGGYTLRLQPGEHVISFQHEDCQFPDIPLSISGSGRAPPAAVAGRWRVCGALTPAQVRPVLVLTAKGDLIQRVLPGDDGKWCTFLAPGEYQAKVEVSEQEQREGLQFYPLNQPISVSKAGISGLSFSVVKATVSGRVVCGEAVVCARVPITLTPLTVDGRYQGTPLTTTAVDGKYTFTNVPLGSAEVSAGGAALCWAEPRHNVAPAPTVTVPDFLHTGYVLHLHSDQDIEVEYESGDERGVLVVPRGSSQHCVKRAATYKLTPKGCHEFNPTHAIVTVNGETVPRAEFSAVSHAATVRILSPSAAPVTLTVTRGGSGGRGERVTSHALTATPRQDGGFEYEHTLYLAESETATVSGSSPSLLFSPRAPSLSGAPRCRPSALTLRARAALTLAGNIVPAVEGVTVTLTADDLTLTHVTQKDGKYKFGPLDASLKYNIKAEKQSYVFGEVDSEGNIAAHKLAEITVKLVDEKDGTPLQGALVVASGGSYRGTVSADASGRVKFPSLAPAQYYVKPHMKEYKFSPAHHLLQAREGLTEHLDIKGVRIAWSCSGRLSSLGGGGWGGAVVRATPRGGGEGGRCAAEEGTTESSGAFRIRGLLPGCVYSLQLKPSTDPELAGLQLIKAPDTIEIKGEKDIRGIVALAVAPRQLGDGSVWVRAGVGVGVGASLTSRALRLTLSPAVPASAPPLMTLRPDPAGFAAHDHPGIMYVLPRLPVDNKTYILQLESTLSKATHSYKDQVFYFNSDGNYKAFDIVFDPKVKSSEQELGATSLLMIPLLALLGAAAARPQPLKAWLLSLLARKERQDDAKKGKKKQ